MVHFKLLIHFSGFHIGVSEDRPEKESILLKEGL